MPIIPFFVYRRFRYIYLAREKDRVEDPDGPLIIASVGRLATADTTPVIRRG